ncbi:MAG: HNH endonuclease [Sutterella sp.]|nr:HNH endonuclease [Sutterella sp.]
MNFREWLNTYNDIIAYTSGRYYGAIYGERINAIAKKLQLLPIYEYQDPESFLAVKAAIEADTEFKLFNRKGNRMYSAALNKYVAYLEFLASTDIVETDKDEIRNRDDLTVTEKEVMIRARVGQGGYRQRVLNEWDNRCAVTGFPIADLILASHIKPWRECTDHERLDAENGLALSPTLDRAFDQGYITFDGRQGRIIFSPVFAYFSRLGLSEDMHLTRRPSATMRTYLEFHQEMIFLHDPEMKIKRTRAKTAHT